MFLYCLRRDDDASEKLGVGQATRQQEPQKMRREDQRNQLGAQQPSPGRARTLETGIRDTADGDLGGLRESGQKQLRKTEVTGRGGGGRDG